MSQQQLHRHVVLKSTDKFPRLTVWSLRVVLLIIAFPIVYGFAHMWFSPIYNKHHFHVQTCTIKGAGISSTGTRSYSHSEHLFISTTDCGYLRFEGSKDGLSEEEFISKLKAQKATKLI